MSYHVLVRFDVPADQREAFKKASFQDARDSLRDEPGTFHFVVINDEHDLNRFFLYEVYESETAFLLHCSNAPFKRFFEAIESYASAPVFLLKGHRAQ